MPLITGNPNYADGLIKASATADTPLPITSITTTSPAYKGVEVDDRWLPKSYLLTYIEGSSWIVDYYSQVLNTDSALAGQQLTTSEIYQDYTKIVNMEMRVVTPLDTVQDDVTKAMEVSGAANLFKFIIPNAGDMFVADIGEGKNAIFRVTDSIKKSIFTEAVYEITYSLDSQLPEKFADLENKVVETLYFHKDYLNLGKNPLIVKSDLDVLLEINEVYSSLFKQYFKKFFSNEYKTLIVPGQSTAIYDHFLVEFLLSQFNTWDSPEVMRLRKLNVSDDQVMNGYSLWDVLKQRDISYFNLCFTKTGLVNVEQFTKNPLLEGIRYTGISYIVYPIDPQLNVDNTIVNNVKTIGVETIVKPSASLGQLNQMVRASNLRNLTDLVDGIKDVTVDNYYVLSSDFYHDVPLTQSVLESTVMKYIKKQTIDPSSLLETAKLYTKWGLLEQFYYIPILMLLMQDVIKGG
jgi:hypothetical protein